MKQEFLLKVTVEEGRVFLDEVVSAAISKGILWGLDIKGVAPPDKVTVEFLPTDSLNVPFVLPEKWCVTTTEKINDKLKAWAIASLNQRESSDWSIGNHYCYDRHTGTFSGWMSYAPERKNGYTEITPEQFLQYVLGEEPQPTNWRIQPKNFDEWCQVVKWAVEKTGNKSLEGYHFHENVAFTQNGEYRPEFPPNKTTDFITFDKFLEYTKK